MDSLKIKALTLSLMALMNYSAHATITDAGKYPCPGNVNLPIKSWNKENGHWVAQFDDPSEHWKDYSHFRPKWWGHLRVQGYSGDTHPSLPRPTVEVWPHNQYAICTYKDATGLRAVAYAPFKRGLTCEEITDTTDQDYPGIECK